VPGLGDIPVLGNLFRSTQFQKNESELMFIVTTQIVKPVNRDDLPKMPAVESLKKGSLLGVDSRTGITGPSGFITNPSETPQSLAPAQPPSLSKPANPGDGITGAPAVATSSPKPPSQ
jgi:pilus assembly protein CpaC